MAPSEKQPFYDPVPPTYEQSLAVRGRQYDDADAQDNEHESQGLLRSGAPSSSRRPDGYRAPTVESEDESDDIDGMLESDTDDEDEAAQVRREMQEMDIEEPSSSRGSIWGKRIGLSLPKWKWSWRPRLPSLPRIRIQLPQRPDADGDNGSGEAEAQEENVTTRPGWQWKMPEVNGMMAIIIFARLLAAFIVLGFVYLLFASDIFGSLNGPMGGGFRFNPEDLKVHVLNSVDPMRLRASVKHYASYAHIAGSEGDFATAMDMESMFSRAALDEVRLDEYVAYLNYPKENGRAVQIMEGDKAVWTAQLDETERQKETAGRQTYVFHGLSKAGDVRGPLIYANRGTREDFKTLTDKGVKVEGAIALVRYDKAQHAGLKVKAAELAGFAGCIIYSDPADFDGDDAPTGRSIPKDGVQRASVALQGWAVGDALTPSWGSRKGLPRMKVKDAPGLVNIPSLPLSWGDAQVLLQKLKGHGDKVPESWEGKVPEVDEYWTGDDKSPIVRLKNEQDEEEKKTIWNVKGKIIGMEQSAKSIIIGNQRDSVAFGAADPHSGTAVMVEMARIFGDLVLRGWRPLRSIEFMSWDGGDYNLIGSTEFVEANLESIREDAYAYINLDNVVAGRDLQAIGSPVFEKTLLHALARLEDPNMNVTLKNLWDEKASQHIEAPGLGGGFVPFQHIAGTSSLDLQFRGDNFPRFSSYDDFELVEKTIDPGFVYHGLMGQIVGLLILDLADKSVMPFDMIAYGNTLSSGLEELQAFAEKHGADTRVSFEDLSKAIEAVQVSTTAFASWENTWDHEVMHSAGWESTEMGQQRVRYNNKMGSFDTMLLDLDKMGGIPNRTQYKHVIFGPQLWSPDEEVHFPAIRDLIEAEDWEGAKTFIQKTAKILRQAAKSLYMGDEEEEGDR